jgi:hypothetical protein
MFRSLITIQIFIFCFALFLTGCKQDHSIIQPDLNYPEICLLLNEVKVKEVWLDLTVNTILDSSKVAVYRDSVLIFESSEKRIDSTLYDYNLIPNNNYFYQAYLYSKDVLIDSSCVLNIQTKDYEWQSLGFDDKYAVRLKLYDPYLYVCAGIYGLWRHDIRNAGFDLEYIGMADTNMSPYTDRGVQEVLVFSQNKNWILVYFQPIDATDHAIFRSIDGGDNWSPADSGMTWSYRGYEYPGRLHRFLEYPDRIIGAGHGVWYTFNFGEFWQHDESQFGAALVYSFQRHPISKNTIWLGGEGLAFDPMLGFSTNVGYTWTEIDLQQVVPYDNAVYSIAFDLNDPKIVYVGMQGAIIKTTNGGQTWISPLVTHPLGYFYRSILSDPNNAFHLWAVAGTDFIETWDKGATWQTLDNPIPQNTGVFDMVWHDNTETIYIATLDGVYSLKP